MGEPDERGPLKTRTRGHHKKKKNIVRREEEEDNDDIQILNPSPEVDEDPDEDGSDKRPWHPERPDTRH